MNTRRVTFRSGPVEIAGLLFRPDDLAEPAPRPALVLATPGSSVKEQVGAIYAQKLKARGYVTLTFDPSCQGESGGEPRDLEDPARRIEDLRCAVDFLTTVSGVDSERIGILGICAGGGYAVSAALTEKRFRAVGTVVASDIGAAFRRMTDAGATLSAVAAQRTAEARGDGERRDAWLPENLAAAEAAGITDPDMLDAVRFYREAPFRHPRSSNRFLFASLGPILGFDAFHLVPELLTQPLQVIVGGRRGITQSYEDGERLFALAPSTKEFLVIDGAGHYDMYHVPQYVDRAVDRLAAFFGATL